MAIAAAKELGAYYTDEAVARFLVRWAIRRGEDTALDPSFGGGVFLEAAAERVRELGGDAPGAVFGVEIDSDVHREFIGRHQTLNPHQLLCADFFSVGLVDLPQVVAVVGNPPFIRFQRFGGDERRRALARAAEAGVELSQLTSSWAPFLVHAAKFVKSGGRLAMVAPAELAHAAYAVPVIEFLRKTFGSTRVLTFRQKLFPQLSEDTVLILASEKGQPFARFSSVDLIGPAALERFVEPATDLPRGAAVDAEAVEQGQVRLFHYLLPPKVRHLYQELQATRHVTRLGALADVGIGYVSGHNEYFHFTQEEADRQRIPREYLRPAVRRGSELRGVRLTWPDLTALLEEGGANWLLHITEKDGAALPSAVARYVETGVKEGVHRRFKCRSRTPWFGVPHVYVGDAFLTYMNGDEPKLVANEAEAVAPNTLHIVRLHALSAEDLGGTGLATLWQTSLTELSCEIEGHSLGGGMLKLEPTEAGRVVVATPTKARQGLEGLARELDDLLRQGRRREARERADRLILSRGLGLPKQDVELLRQASEALRERRTKR